MTVAIKEAPLSTIKLLGSYGGSINGSDLVTEIDYLLSDDQEGESIEPWNIIARSEVIEHVLLRDWQH
jgi:hypothetical protein